jgi:hypothetical protein
MEETKSSNPETVSCDWLTCALKSIEDVKFLDAKEYLLLSINFHSNVERQINCFIARLDALEKEGKQKDKLRGVVRRLVHDFNIEFKYGLSDESKPGFGRKIKPKKTMRVNGSKHSQVTVIYRCG